MIKKNILSSSVVFLRLVFARVARLVNNLENYLSLTAFIQSNFQIKYTRLIVLTICLLSIVQNVFAQCQVQITGDNTGMTATYTGTKLQKLEWKRNGVTVFVEEALYNQNGITVAGGNGLGTGLNQLVDPHFVWVDTDDNVYVVNEWTQGVLKWAPSATEGIIVAGGNGYGSNLDQFLGAQGLFLDSLSNLYIADESNQRIVKWAPGATEGTIIAGGNGYGSAPNQFQDCYGMRPDKEGNIYVTDVTLCRVQKFTPGATDGITVAGGNGQGAAANQLDQPQDVFVDDSGNIFVSDFGNKRVQKWAPGATEGVTVAGGNGAGGAANQLNGVGISLDPNGNLYIADYWNMRVQKWSPGATQGETIAGGHGVGSAPNQLYLPVGLYLDSNGTLYVPELYGFRVQKFLLMDLAKTFSPPGTGVYTVTATAYNGCVVTSNPVSIPDPPVAKPALFVSPTAFTANWLPVPSVDHYELDVYDTKNLAFLPGYNSKVVNGTSQLVSGTKAGRHYAYVVRAVGLTTSSNSNVIPVAAIKNLTLRTICSGNPAVSRSWKIINNNPFPVDVWWNVPNTTQSGSLSATPGESVFYTQTVAGVNRARIVWFNDKLVQFESLKSSTNAACPPAAREVQHEIEYIDFKVDAYPNPIADQFIISITSEKDELVNIRLVNQLGQVVYVKSIRSNTRHEVDASIYAPGIYTLRADNSAHHNTLRLVKK